MKQIFLLLLLTFLCPVYNSNCMAQNIKGKVIDDNGNPLEFSPRYHRDITEVTLKVPHRFLIDCSPVAHRSMSNR